MQGGVSSSLHAFILTQSEGIIAHHYPFNARREGCKFPPPRRLPLPSHFLAITTYLSTSSLQHKTEGLLWPPSPTFHLSPCTTPPSLEREMEGFFWPPPLLF